MSYLRQILQPGEQVTRIGRPHWIIFREAILLALFAIAILIYGYRNNNYWGFALIGAGILGAGALIFWLRSWFLRSMAEIAVTNKRVIYKTGFINRHTEEMPIDKVQMVGVDQSILGRLLDYGTVHIKGTGQNLDDLPDIAAPIALRNAIEAR